MKRKTKTFIINNIINAFTPYSQKHFLLKPKTRKNVYLV